jgi:hypothetical protein
LCEAIKIDDETGEIKELMWINGKERLRIYTIAREFGYHRKSKECNAVQEEKEWMCRPFETLHFLYLTSRLMVLIDLVLQLS